MNNKTELFCLSKFARVAGGFYKRLKLHIHMSQF